MSSPPSMREQQRAFTRGRLLEAGRATFEANGYAATTVEDIAVATGASRATFYLHFKTKLELLLAILETVKPDWVSRYRELDDYLDQNPQASRNMLRAWLENALDFWTTNGGLLRVVAQAYAVESELQAGDRLATTREMVNGMTHWLERNGADKDSSRQRAVMLERMTAYLLEELAVGDFQLDHEIAIDLLTDLWWTVFGPTEKA